MPPLDPKEWIVQVDKSLKHMPSNEQQYWEKRSIYRVPAYITKLNSEAYRPQAVSFGPYHCDEALPMEDHKHRVLLHFLKRSRKPLESFLESLKEVVGDLQASYDALDQMWKKDTDRFLQLMITDGCFMLEILRFANGEADDYAPNDPIFSDHGMLYKETVIRRDMLLLENQLPMLVLDRLVAVCDGEKEDEYINWLILNFFGATRPNNGRMGKCLHVLDVFRKNRLRKNGVSKRSLNNASMGKCLHVLDVFGKSLPMVSKKNEKRKRKDSEEDSEEIPPATELHEHGIQFKQSSTDHLDDISFASGILRLPFIGVDDTTESMFLNLIAFEGSHIGAGTEGTHEGSHFGAETEVTSYIWLMDNLIDKGEDVALLRKKGIIENYMESDEAAAKLFNSLAKDVMLDPDSSLHDVTKKVRHYCKKSWPDWRANLMHTYFRNPWVMLSLIAAFLLFGLTTIQTVYTVLGYKK